MEELLDGKLAGIGLVNWLEALGCTLGAFAAGKLVAFVSSRILRRLAARTRNRVDDIVLAVVEKPLVFLVLVLGIGLGVGRLGLEGEAQLWMGRIVGALTTLALAWAIDKGIDSIITEYLVPVVERSDSKLDDQLLPLLRKGARLLVWSLALLLALKNAGYDVGALIAGLGIGGVAIALAAKDTLSNLFGSVAVFFDRPFAIGDRIKVAGFDGTIMEIGIRSSRLRTLDNRVVTLPNSTFATSAIENVSSEPSTKVAQSIELAPGIGHEGAARAIAILLEAAAAQEGLDGGTVAALAGFGQYSLKLSFVIFIKKGADYFGTLSATNLEVLRRFSEAGVELARPAILLEERKA
ncbi:MAG TPA: mechanosensitive ion channel [Spirochaetales bacterium]|nr:mechanosensitive ion channel [Spirochaetales bacterium]HRY54640.1 mechanosensitive ion channel [Spirochaetia bacterium]HRZ65648.1 mechanosensitive ion channel [Spirochaetia bacterium]